MFADKLSQASPDEAYKADTLHGTNASKPGLRERVVKDLPSLCSGTSRKHINNIHPTAPKHDA